jgi:murein L,D-transpeptidase YcbB/YkuD
MRGFRFEHFLTSTALVLLLAGSPAYAAPEGEAAAIEAAVPVPEPANVPPPTLKDIEPQAPAERAAAPALPEAKPVEKLAEPAPAAPAAAPVDAKPATAETKIPDIMTPEVPKAAAAPKAPEAPKTASPAPAAVPQPAPTAAAPAATPPVITAAAPAVNPADQAIADQLRTQVTGKLTKMFDRKNERAAVEAFYAGRSYAPAWIANGTETPRAKAAIARLKNAGQDGLDPIDYVTPDFTKATSPEALAEADLRLTDAVLTYARHAQTGRVHFSRVAADIDYKLEYPEPADILSKVTTGQDVAAVLDSYNPPHAGYKALKAKLAELRGKTEDRVNQIGDGPVLKVEKKNVMEDPRVPVLRVRLGVTGDATDQRYDASVAAAVRKFQESADIKPTGQLDSRTVNALNGPTRGRQVDTIIANLERWRWLPRKLGAPAIGNAYVMLNVPDFTLKVMQNDKQAWTTRVVVGKPGNHATPMLTETMKFITVNPTWNVPPSIVYGEYLPALQQDPGVLDRMGLKLVQNRDGSVHISQPPGERNALGRIRFNFPNKFLVYQHDTPDKNLFNKEVRAFSHGCMRVLNPDKYAEVLLGITMPNQGYTADKVRSMYGHSEININFPTPIPVHITYQTAFVDDAGKLEMRNDVYGRDARVLAALRGEDRRVADIAIERAQPNYSRPPAQLPNGMSFAGNNEPSFLERLFGAAPAAAPPARPQRAVRQRPNG